jgi:hypothetical protein
LRGAALASSLGVPYANTKTPARTMTQSEVVALIRKKVEAKLKKDTKASLGDYIRLVQLQKELEEADVRQLNVTWVDPEKPEYGSGK